MLRWIEAATVLFALIALGLLACSPRGEAPRSRVAREAPRPDGTWRNLPDEPLIWAGATFEDAILVDQRPIPARFLGGARIELEGLGSSFDRIQASACLVEGRRFVRREMVTDIRAGARVFIRGSSGSNVRFSDSPDVAVATAQAPASEFSVEACAPDPVGPLRVFQRRCVYPRPAHELSFEDTPRTLRGDVPIEVLEERGEWRRVRAETETHRIEGWMLADDVLSESEIPSYVTTREVAGLPAGTPIVRADRWFVLTTLQGREVLRALEHDVPDDARTHDETQRAARAFASTRPPIMSAGSNCWAPGDDLTEPGLLQRSSVRQVFRANHDAVRTCYENRLQWNQSLEGRVSVRLRIGPSGRTAGATVVHPGSFELAVEQCIARRILTWRFPRPEGGCVIVNYPFYLQPENSQPENSQP